MTFLYRQGLQSPGFRISFRFAQAIMHCPAPFAFGEAPVAQLDRALDYESRGREFESSPVRHFVFTPGNTT